MANDKTKFVDLTEEASKRSDEEATIIARNLESDDFNPGGQGPISSPEGDSAAESKVATSIDDE